jgi:hypothetical protein
MLGRCIVATVVAVLSLALTAPPAGAQRPRGVIVPAAATPWPGKILVAHDEWVLSDHGIEQAPTARQFALNVAAWFTGGRPGRFLVYSPIDRLQGEVLAATMRAAGHTWTIDTSEELTLETLLAYDAVLLAGDEVDNALLIDYVRAGGGVFLHGGTGIGGDVWEAAHWNTFLGAFGLGFEPNYNRTRIPGVYPVRSSAPLFRGVVALYEETGNTIVKLDPADPNVQILVSSEQGQGLYAVYASTARAIEVEISPNRLHVPSRGAVSVGIPGTARLDVRTIDADSVRVLGIRPRGGHYDYSLKPGTEPLIGRTFLRFWRVQRADRYLDLVLRFDTQEIVRAVERTLGQSLADGDVVALTLTGRLKRQFGGHPLVGEDLVVVSRPRGR